MKTTNSSIKQSKLQCFIADFAGECARESSRILNCHVHSRPDAPVPIRTIDTLDSRRVLAEIQTLVLEVKSQ